MEQGFYELWLKFVETGEIDERVRPYIADSWKRSKAIGLDAYKNQKGLRIPPEEFEKVLEKNADLVAVARPVIENLNTILLHIPTVITLSDADGYILTLVGNQAMIDHGVPINYAPGCKWSEDKIGTNAITMCLSLNQPVQLHGEEAYLEDHHQYTCAGSPIHNEDGTIIGTLSTVNEISRFSNHTLGMVVYAANTIEKQIALLNMNKHMKNAFDSIPEGIIITNSDFKIKYINHKGSSIIKYNVISQDIRTLIQDIPVESMRERMDNKNFTIRFMNKSIFCMGSINIIHFNGDMAGITVVFKEEKSVNRLVTKISGSQAKYVFDDIITQNKKMRRAIETAEKFARVNCNLLLYGESGTGKELFAQAVHNASSRANGPFVAVNCAALPRDLMESELFGYEEGAFTGARKSGYTGKFELANGGTIFLDEIGELPIEVQPKLLRVLDSHKVMRIGGKCEKDIDVRVIAATNRNLEQEIADRNFRLDLYYRISLGIVEIPPLRERKDDIPLLCSYFLEKFNRENDGTLKVMDERFIENLCKYNWKGNVRELQNTVARSFYLCDGETISAEYLPGYMVDEGNTAPDEVGQVPAAGNQAPTVGSIEPAVERKEPSDGRTIQDSSRLELMEREAIIEAINECGGNVTKAAQHIGISKPTIYRKMKKYGIDMKKNPSIQ